MLFILINYSIWTGAKAISVFPKSIGEFDEDQFLKIISMFKNTNLKSERIFLVSSVREQSDSMDIARLKRIIDVFEDKHGYICLDDKDTQTRFKENRGLRYYYYDFVYPDDIKDFIVELMDQCKNYQNNGESCEDDCENLLNRQPILRTGHIRYQIKRLQK